MSNKRPKKGFSLIEVVIAMAVILIVVFSATNILLSIIKSNTSNINTLIAYGLAQEGVEAVRNVRDSDWLLGASFEGTVGNFASKPWNSTLPDAAGQTQSYAIDYNYLGNSATDPFEKVGSDGLSRFAPWKLVAIDDADPAKSDSTQLFKKDYTVNGEETRYTLDPVQASITSFHRYVTVSSVPYVPAGKVSLLSDPVRKYRVFCVVAWQENGRDKEVRLDTEITDWKQSLL